MRFHLYSLVCKRAKKVSPTARNISSSSRRRKGSNCIDMTSSRRALHLCAMHNTVHAGKWISRIQRIASHNNILGVEMRWWWVSSCNAALSRRLSLMSLILFSCVKISCTLCFWLAHMRVLCRRVTRYIFSSGQFLSFFLSSFKLNFHDDHPRRSFSRRLFWLFP